MNKIKGIKVCFITAAIALLAVFIAAPAGAWDLNRLLTGDYASNMSFVCASAYGNFDQDLNRNPDPPGLTSVMVSGSSQGVTSYDGHGGYTFRGQVLSLTHDPVGSTAPLKSPVSQYDMECRGTYKVNHDLSTEGEGDCRIDPSAGPFTLPPYPPEFYMVINGVRSKGQLLGTMGNILALRSDTETNVETVDFYNFPYPGIGIVPGPVKVLERICSSSGTNMKIVGPRWFFNPNERSK